MPLLEIEVLSVSYEAIEIVHEVSFNIDEGEIVSLLGANGAGKSTILKSISGLVAVTSGRIEFDGKRIDSMPAYKRVEMGLIQVPEGRRLFPFMTTFENLKLGATSLRARKSYRETLEWVLTLFPIIAMRKAQLASTLSGGEQQMLAIGRGLMAKPKTLMLDEPSLGLAPLIVKELFEIIKRINKEGTTLLLVEQNVQNSLLICKRGYVLENGKILLNGLGSDLLTNTYVKKAYLGI
jgi:branched-chain amino acid transport system ATP-binding protein